MTGFNGNIATWKLIVATVGLTILIGVGPVYAQSPVDQNHPAAPAPAPDAMPGTQRDGMMPMMDMCGQMMSGAMMSMAGRPEKMDPKFMAHMFQMRGEMMKAMGEVMMKHGRMMEGGATK